MLTEDVDRNPRTTPTDTKVMIRRSMAGEYHYFAQTPCDRSHYREAQEVEDNMYSITSKFDDQWIEVRRKEEEIVSDCAKLWQLYPKDMGNDLTVFRVVKPQVIRSSILDLNLRL